MATTIRVQGYDGILFEGEGEIGPVEGGEWTWRLDFIVPNTQVAQFQMRRGEEVRLTLDDDAVHRAWIGGFGFEPDASAAGMGGHGRIHLFGRGERPPH